MPDEHPRFEVLKGLPPYGERAVAFSATGEGKHREGYVVQFWAADGRTWIGNFQRGFSSFSTVELHPDNHHIVVVASGQGYIIDPDNPQSVEYLSVYCDLSMRVNDQLLLVTPVDIDVLDAAGLHWRSGRISWDGIRHLRVDTEASTISGEAWSPLEDRWLPFELNLRTQALKGGSYSLTISNKTLSALTKIGFLTRFLHVLLSSFRKWM